MKKHLIDPKNNSKKIETGHISASKGENDNSRSSEESICEKPNTINILSDISTISKTDEFSDTASQITSSGINHDSESAYIQENDFIEHKKIGKYQITRSLGNGASGKVKLGVCIETGEKVAIKIVNRGDCFGDNSETTKENKKPKRSMKLSLSDLEKIKRREERIFREVLISSLLCHPHIVRLKNFYYNENFFYLVFDYVQGEQLLDIVVKNGPLCETFARRYFRQILSAISYIHKNHIVHRDLKIENILLDEDGNIKILDFGLSNFFDSQRFLKTFCGSLYFAAPELLMGREYQGPELDVWSLGVTLFVITTASVPFDDQSISKLHKRIKRAKIEYPPKLSNDLCRLIGGMLNPNPNERMCLDSVINSKWIQRGYETPVNNFIHTRYLLPKINMNLVHILDRVFYYQFPNLKTELINFSDMCKKILYESAGNGSIPSETDIWRNRATTSIYYLCYENFVLTHKDGWLKMKNLNTYPSIEKDTGESVFGRRISDKRAEDIHNFVNFLFAKEKENPFSKYFLGSCLLKEQNVVSVEEMEMDKSTENFFENVKNKAMTIDDSTYNNKNIGIIRPKLKTSFIKGVFKGIALKNLKCHEKLREKLEKYMTKNTVTYDITEKNYQCNFGNGKDYCTFKISLYLNILLNSYFLSLTRLTGSKETYKKMLKSFEIFGRNCASS